MNRTKLILACNTMPTTNDLTHGFLRRLVIVPFKEQFKRGDPRRDPFLKSKLRQELSGICNRLIEAYSRLKERGYFTAGDQLDRNTEAFAQANDSVHLFLNDAVEVNDEGLTSNSEMYSGYSMFCQQYNIKPLNMVWFMRRFCEISSTEVERVQMRGERMKVIKGLTLRKIY